MKNIKKLKEAIAQGKKFVWKDPEPIEGNDYTINYIEEIQDDWDNDTPITIQYGEGSEAEVTVEEIHEVISLEQYAKKMGYDADTELDEIQENEEVWDYPIDELAYVLEEVTQKVAFVEIDGEIRICELV